MKIAQLKNGYRYNCDTLVLYDFILSLGKKLDGEILDVGCGCGILGLLLKRDFKNLNLNGLDIQEINIEISKHNAKLNSLEASFFKDDFKEFKSQKRFKIIVSNPPFYHDGVKFSQNKHLSTSRYAKNLTLKDFLNTANSHLTANGELYFCYESGAIEEIFTISNSLKLKITKLKFVYTKEDKSSKLVLIKAQKNSKSMCEILPPLFMRDGKNDSDEAIKIFKRAATVSEDYEC